VVEATGAGVVDPAGILWLLVLYTVVFVIVVGITAAMAVRDEINTTTTTTTTATALPAFSGIDSKRRWKPHDDSSDELHLTDVLKSFILYTQVRHLMKCYLTEGGSKLQFSGGVSCLLGALNLC
jgi:hypothetical protein